jgi:hypothetical protein
MQQLPLNFDLADDLCASIYPEVLGSAYLNENCRVGKKNCRFSYVKSLGSQTPLETPASREKDWNVDFHVEMRKRAGKIGTHDDRFTRPDAPVL